MKESWEDFKCWFEENYVSICFTAGAVIVIVVLIAVAIKLNNDRMAAGSLEKVRELFQQCDSDNSQSTRVALLNIATLKDQEQKTWSNRKNSTGRQIADLAFPDVMGEVENACNGMQSLFGPAEGSYEEKISTYQKAEGRINQIERANWTIKSIRQSAEIALNSIDTANIRIDQAQNQYNKQSWRAINLSWSKQKIDAAHDRINSAWTYMSMGDWKSAYFRAQDAKSAADDAYEYASTPTPKPTSTPEPTNTPRPTNSSKK